MGQPLSDDFSGFANVNRIEIEAPLPRSREGRHSRRPSLKIFSEDFARHDDHRAHRIVRLRPENRNLEAVLFTQASRAL